MLRRFLTSLAYLAAVTIVVLGTVVLVAYARGYSYDFKNHRFYLNGLIILTTAPSGADITINGKVIKNHHTPYRSTLEAGWYNFQVSKPGYQTWTKRLQLIASEVTFAEYVILLPDNIKTDRVVNTDQVVSAVQSHDHHQVAYITGGNNPAVWVMNIDSRQTFKLYTPAKAQAATASSPASPAETLTSVVWSADDSKLLVQTDNSGTPTFYLVNDSSGSTPTNLTSLFQLNFSALQFNPGNSNQLYWLDSGGLRTIDASAKTVSAVLADNVTSFAFGADRVLYIQTTPLGRSLWSISGSQKQELIQSLPQSDKYQLVYTKYRGTDMLAVIPSTTQTLTIYRDIFGSTPTSKVITKAASQVLASSDGNYFVFADGNKFGLYDIEKDKILQSSTLPATISQFSLYDNYHVAIVMGGKLYLAEYDGNYLTPLTDQEAGGSLPFATSDQKHLISLRQVDAETGVQFYSTEIKK